MHETLFSKLRYLIFKNIFVAVAVMFRHVVDIFVSASGKGHENGPDPMFTGIAHPESHSVGTFQRRDDPFVTAELEE